MIGMACAIVQELQTDQRQVQFLKCPHCGYNNDLRAYLDNPIGQLADMWLCWECKKPLYKSKTWQDKRKVRLEISII